MILKRTECELAIPECGLFCEASLLIPGGHRYQLNQVSAKGFANLRKGADDGEVKRVYGVPTYCHYNDGIFSVYPWADQDYAIMLRYYPKMVQV